MGKPLYDKLPKKDLERHFPNISHGGKGSHARKYSTSGNQAYRDGWDAIFGKKDVAPTEDTDNGTNQSTTK